MSLNNWKTIAETQSHIFSDDVLAFVDVVFVVTKKKKMEKISENQPQNFP